MYDSTSVTADKNGLKDYSTPVSVLSPHHTHTHTHFPHHSLYNWATLKPTKVPSSLTHIHLCIFHLRTPISFPPLSSFLVCLCPFMQLTTNLSVWLSFPPCFLLCPSASLLTLPLLFPCHLLNSLSPFLVSFPLPMCDKSCG